MRGIQQCSEKLLPVVYDELRPASSYLRQEWSDHTLQTTASRLCDGKHVCWFDKFLANKSPGQIGDESDSPGEPDERGHPVVNRLAPPKRRCAVDLMSLTAVTRLGPYEILVSIGAAGITERTQDSRSYLLKFE